MNTKLLGRIFLLILITYVIGTTRASSQVKLDLGHLTEVPEHGEVRGVVSFHNNERVFLAIWYYVKEPSSHLSGGSLLVIFERKENKYVEVFRHDDSTGEGTWERIVPLYQSRLTGLIVSASQIATDDEQWLIGLVNGMFKVVHRSDGTSEFFDIDDDGFPEIFDSVWPDGDGSPDTTRVFIWDGNKYRLVTEVKYIARRGASVLNAVTKASRRVRTKIEE